MHIVQRGHDRKSVFATDKDYLFYLANLQERAVELGVKIFSYCLMTNHVHLILAPGEHPDGISGLIKTVAARQTRYVNKREGRTGTLWEGRFKASLIDTDNYLLACHRYVDLNPIRAFMVGAPSDYRWSSYRYLSGDKSDDWLTPSPAYLALGQTASARAKAYRQFVRSDIADDELSTIRGALQRNQVTGTDLFRQQIERRIGRRISARSQGRPPNRREE